MTKAIIFNILLAGTIAIACNRKALPTITERKWDSPIPERKSTTGTRPDLARGKMIFTSRCGRCHDLPKPEQYSAERWKGVLSYMNPRAGLSDEQSIHVTAYLQANAAK